MDYLTQEELFELEHQDELDAISEMEPTSCSVDSLFGTCSFKVTDPSSDILSEKNTLNKENTVNKNEAVIMNNLTENFQPKINGKTGSIGCENDENNLSEFKEGKENSPSGFLAKPSVKRKLSFSMEDIPNHISESNQVSELEDECSESLIPQNLKRAVSELSVEVENSTVQNAAKRRCNENNAMLAEFLKDKICTQARPTLFEESSRTFLIDQVTVTHSDGRRIYLNLNDEEDQNNTVLSFSARTSSLLPTSIVVLKSQYFLMEEERILREKENAKNKEVTEVQITNDLCVNGEGNVDSLLWVEKYCPESYMHLLSEEGINRTLLQWLKLWDKVVFGREKKAKKKNVEPQFNKKFQKLGELVEDLDEHGRPYHKVAFLCGPPGLGKTTLAIIIAKHAGYNVVELNASDDRSPEAFRTSLEAATQMKAVLHQDHRPNCLIFDEIDGAPAPSINVLLSFIKSTGVTKGKRRKGDIPLLMRPIICICNDPYSAALKPLRQLALILNFPPTTASRLSSRLNEISAKEGLKAEMAALTLLCEKACNDIRSCLSTLQFIRRMKNELKISDLRGLHIGQKDMHKSLFGVWQDVFYSTEKKSVSEVHRVVQAFGDYEKTYIGLFENYITIKCKHRNLNSVWKGADWLCFADIIQQQIAHSQLYLLLPYLPYPAVAFHVLYASNSVPLLSYPTAYYEHRAKRTQLLNTLSSMTKDMVSSLKTFLDPSVILLDVFPFLLEIIKPTLRPVNIQLYSERERNELRRVIELMLAFGLNYRQERSQDGTYNYVLDPNIEEVTKFSDSKSRHVLTYSTKQMIAREVEVEQMRKGDSSSDQKAEKQVEEKTRISDLKDVMKKNVTSEKPVLDFFGRKIQENTKKVKNTVPVDPRDQVWFHFKEGYSNAVRRTVYIKDLL